MTKPDPKDVCAECEHPRSLHIPDCVEEVSPEGKFCRCGKFVEAKGKAA